MLLKISISDSIVVDGTRMIWYKIITINYWGASISWLWEDGSLIHSVGDVADISSYVGCMLAEEHN
jgi:hypothetical protein